MLAEARPRAGGCPRRCGHPWGGYHGVFADPDGHRWEVAHNPFWPLTEDGRAELPD